jgi:two-component system, sensor histidine kinase and response regulator
MNEENPGRLEEKANILLVDDRPENLLALESVVSGMDHNVVKAQSGEEALRCLLRDEFAVILLDVEMPGINGFELAPLIRTHQGLQNTPIIFVTAWDRSEEYLLRGYSAGAVDFLFKPLIPQILRGKVSFFVESYKKSAQIRRQSERLRSLNEDLESFSYSVSHDLRAPLRQVLAFTKLLMDEHSNQLSPAAAHYLKRVAEGTQRMDGLVRSLLRLAQVERHELFWQKMNLNDLVQSAAAQFQMQTEGRTIEWKIGVLSEIVCDVVLIRQVFTNLLSNAIKFTRTREHAAIEVGQLSQEGRTILFVRDNGVGFDMKYAGRLFGAFQRLHRQEDFEGFGIGLAVVRRIIRRHEGTVWAEAEPDRGATFYFTLEFPIKTLDRSRSFLPKINTEFNRE